VDPDGRRSWLRISISAGLVVVLAIVVARYPPGPAVAGIPLLGFALLIWRAPGVAIPLLLAALPLANLAPLTGSLFVTEFDMLLLAALAARLVCPRPPLANMHVLVVSPWLIAAVFLSAMASALVGLLPLQPLDVNAFANYYSHYNALRILKGFVEGFALVGLMRSDALAGRDWRNSLIVGMSAGLAGVVAVVLWERHVFPGLLHLSSVYRITATMFEMHIGGGYIESYLVAAIPFALVGAVAAQTTFLRLVAGAIFVAATYAMAVTYARGGYAGYAVALSVLIAAGLARGLLARRWVAMAGLVSLLAVISACVALPVVGGSYMQWRLSMADVDARTRLAHWRDALDLIPPTWTARIFGAGLGTFPERYFYGSAEGNRPGTFSYRRDEGSSYVRLGGGEPLYLGQRVSIQPHTNYRLVVEFRSETRGASLNVPLCQKSLLYSFSCAWFELTPSGIPGVWDREVIVFDSRDLGRGSWHQRRPVELALVNFKPGTVIDVRLIGLYDKNGNDLVKNGNFSRGGDFWFFSTDNHLPWHIENFFVQLRFEQGWLGLLAVGSLMLAALATLARAVPRGDAAACATLAAISGVLVVGFFNSLLEAPRLMALVVLLLCLGAGWPGSRAMRRQVPSAAQI
jgi:hypothetical protein